MTLPTTLRPRKTSMETDHYSFQKRTLRNSPVFFRKSTLPKTNSSPLKIGFPKRKVVFQPSIFRCGLLVSGRVASRNIWIPCVTGPWTCCWAKSQRHVLLVDPGKVKWCGAVILTLWEVFKSSQI